MKKITLYLIITSLFLLSGCDTSTTPIDDNLFYTEYTIPTINVIEESVRFDSFDFDLEIVDPDSIFVNTEITLHGGDESITLEGNDYYVEDLIPNTNYTLTVVYYYDLGEENGIMSQATDYRFTTLQYPDPQTSLYVLDKTNDSITFYLDTEITDLDVTITEVTVKTTEGVIKTLEGSSNTINIDGLQSGKTYDFIIEYQADLNDGNGLVTFETSISEQTNETVVPQLTIENESITYGSYLYELSIIDEDASLVSTQATLYKGETVIESSQDNELLYTNLDSNESYKLVIEYTYDLNNGGGYVVNSIEKDFTTLSYPESPVNIVTHYVGKDKVVLKFETDATEIDYEFTTVFIYDNTGFVREDTLSGTYAHIYELDFETIYTFEITYEVDFDDDCAPVTYTRSIVVTTDKPNPIEFHDIVATTTTITFDFTRYDDNEGEILELSLIERETGETVATITDFSDLIFENLSPNTDYDIYLLYENTNAGLGEVRSLEGHYKVVTKSE